MNIRAASHRLAILAALSLFAGCSGGGGSGGGTAPTPTYTVTATVSANGTITPASSTVSQGGTTSLTLTPDANYVIESVTGCNGTLDGSTYTTGAITEDCSISASFALQKYEVSTAPGSNGAIAPASSLISHGSMASFSVTPDANYVVESVAGCGGVFDAGTNTYTTGAITAACSVSVSFVLKSYEVTASAVANGAITPASSIVSHGSTTALTVTPNTNYIIDNVSGCGGTLAGSTFTTGAITAPCAVSATFAPTYSIGGSVSGLASGVSLMLLNNGGDAETITANGPFTFTQRLLNGDSYTLTLNSQPLGQQCTITNDAGVVNGADVSNVTVNCVNIVSPLYPLNGANWNDYVKNDGTDVRMASDSACTGTETGGYAACIHGGERRMVRVPDALSCAGLTATDTLGAFDWRCDTSQGYVRFVSKLKYEKRLADLIDFTAPGAWKENGVTVMDGVTPLLSTAATQWWSNPLVIDNDGMTAAESTTTGTIYLVTAAGAQAGYAMGADHVGLVIKPGVVLSAGLSGAVMTANSKKFLWIEGDMLPVYAGVDLYGIKFSVVRRMKITNSNGRAIYLSSSHNNSLSQLLLANTGSLGLNLYGSSNNTVLDVTAVGGGGIQIESSHNNVIGMVTSANNSTYGVSNSTSNNNYLFTASLANSPTGLNINGNANGTYADIITSINGWSIVMYASSDNKFTGLLKVGGNIYGNCSVTNGTSPGLVTATCATEGASDATLTTGISLAAAFVGKVAVDDTANLSDLSGGVLAYPADPAFDWTSFIHGLRAWGKEGSVFPNTDNRGRWTTGAGRIWDWSLASADTVAKDVLALPGGNDTLTHTWSDNTTAIFLRHAIELEGDGDGLCESNESCLFTPNIGAYQGHGALVSAGAFADGTITGVTLMRYESNGR